MILFSLILSSAGLLSGGYEVDFAGITYKNVTRPATFKKGFGGDIATSVRVCCVVTTRIESLLLEHYRAFSTT